MYRAPERRVGMHDLQERIALVEARVRHMDSSLRPLLEDTRKIRERLDSQRGFVAGFSAAFALLWSALLAAVYHLWRLKT